MKYIKLLLPLTLLLFVACDDEHEHIHQETKEEMIQEFIEHVEDGHYSKQTLQDTVAIADTPALNEVGHVYSLVCAGAKRGTVSYTFTEETETEEERTIFSNSAVTITVKDPAGETQIPEESVDVTKFNATVIKQMAVYHLTSNTKYAITLEDITVDTLRLFVAPRGIEGDHDHE